jgi:hypothetical protein
VAVIVVQLAERGNVNRLGLLTKGELEVAQLGCWVKFLFGAG